MAGGSQGRVERILTVVGDLSMPLMHLPRRMSAVRLASGELIIFSAIALDEYGMDELEAFGRPAYLVVPSQMHRLDAPSYAKRYPDIGVVAPHDFPNRRRQQRRVSGGANQEIGVRQHVPLRVGNEEVARRLVAQGGDAGVGDHAHDLVEVACRVPPTQADFLAQGAAVGEVLPGEGFIDDRDARRVFGVGRGEVASLNQRHAERGKVSRGDGVAIG